MNNINERFSRILIIPNRKMENFDTNEYSSTFHLLDKFSAYPRTVGGDIPMEIHLRKRPGDSSYRFYFGLKVPDIQDGMVCHIHYKFSFIAGNCINPDEIQNDENQETAEEPVSGSGDVAIEAELPAVSDVAELAFQENGVMSDIRVNANEISSDLFNQISDYTSSFKECDHQFDSSSTGSSMRAAGPGPFGMSDYSIIDRNWKATCASGYIVVLLTIYRVKRVITPEFYQKMMFEKLYPEYLSSEVGQLRTQTQVLTKLLKSETDAKRAVTEAHQKEISKMKSQLNKFVETTKDLQREVDRFREDNSVLKKRISDLEEELAAGDRELKTQELVKALSETDISGLKFKGTLSEKQSLQVKISELMIQLATEIRKDELCADCGNAKRSMAFKPCGHFYYCSPCYSKDSTKVHLCPLCTHEVESCVKVEF